VRILIVDDSVVMRKIVEGALRHSGLDLAEVLHAGDGAEGLAVLEARAARGELIDLVLCDVHMPVLDGLGFLAEKHRRNLAPAVPVVMITADASDPHLLHAIAAGAQGYIAKPFTVQQMRARVASLLTPAATRCMPAGSPTPHPTGGASSKSTLA
jgi:two-component system, chemotaxis family, chemotaxis protein CheY